MLSSMVMSPTNEVKDGNVTLWARFRVSAYLVLGERGHGICAYREQLPIILILLIFLGDGISMLSGVVSLRVKLRLELKYGRTIL